jgi:hypothetical protein
MPLQRLRSNPFPPRTGLVKKKVRPELCRVGKVERGGRISGIEEGRRKRLPHIPLIPFNIHHARNGGAAASQQTGPKP